jgi:hypothetical protein
LDAFKACALGKWPMPDWLIDAAWDELHWSYFNRPRGDAMERTAAKQDKWRDIHQRRHDRMNSYLFLQRMDIDLGFRKTPLNETEAAKRAAEWLHKADDPAKTAWPNVLKSYKSLRSKQI